MRKALMQHEQARYQQAREAAEACLRVLKEQFGAKAAYLFGSLAGQSPWHSQSDIDIAVEGLPPEQYFRALSTLWELLPPGMELDLVPLEDAPPKLVARIKGEVTVPEEPKAALREEITDQLANLDRVVREAQGLLEQVSPSPTSLEINAAGKLVHDFYSGVERIFERILVRLGPGVPTGRGWHTLLLRRMESAVEGRRPAVIDHAMALRFLDYLRFRHLFRHTYGYELQWERLHPLLEGLQETLTELRQQLERFLAALE